MRDDLAPFSATRSTLDGRSTGVECPQIMSTDMYGLSCKSNFLSWPVACRMLLTHLCPQEVNMTRRLIGFLVTLALSLLLVAPLTTAAQSPAPVPRIALLTLVP